MFDFDSFREIWATIRKNKMRTFLTGFAVAWGIFMLIILLSAGNGFRNGVMHNFEDQAINTVTVWSGRTSMPYKGLKSGRMIAFDQRDLKMLRDQIPEIEYLSASIGRSVAFSYGDEYYSSWVEGITSEGAFINNIVIKEGKGRFINYMDDILRRKVIVLHPDQAKVLFGDNDPIGEIIYADKIPYRVVGVYHKNVNFDNQPSAYVPLSVAQILYNRGWGFWNIQFTVDGLNTLEANEEFKDRVRAKMGQFHGFDPKDRSAMGIWSTSEQAIQFNGVFMIINIFIIIVGLASLMAGVVGVGNIMLITVKERTREIGIRKAIGASPASVVWLVILESIFITTIAGYLGIVFGVGITELISMAMESGVEEGQVSTFMDPTVDMGTVIWATVFLIGCGVVAGLIPALKAARVSPIEAMRAE